MVVGEKLRDEDVASVRVERYNYRDGSTLCLSRFSHVKGWMWSTELLKCPDHFGKLRGPCLTTLFGLFQPREQCIRQ